MGCSSHSWSLDIYIALRLPEGDLTISPAVDCRVSSCSCASPEGTVESTRVLPLLLCTLCLQHKRSSGFHHRTTPGEALALLGRHRSGKRNQGAEHRRRRGSRSPFALFARNDADCKGNATDQRRFVQVGARDVCRPTALCLASQARDPAVNCRAIVGSPSGRNRRHISKCPNSRLWGVHPIA